ncbi:MAG: thioredoxin family protein [Candidatus Bathyarchaeia archaeon]|jgi:thioredoxin-like negative regulator of GroEL
MTDVDNGEDLNVQLKKNERVLAFFYASWCPYCNAFVPVFNKKISGFSSAVVIHVLLDDFDNPLWDEYGIDAIPTVIYFEKGKVSRRLDGAFGVGLKEKQFTAWLEELAPS